MTRTLGQSKWNSYPEVASRWFFEAASLLWLLIHIIASSDDGWSYAGSKPKSAIDVTVEVVTIKWSRTLTSISESKVVSFLVMLISLVLGVVDPLGWLWTRMRAAELSSRARLSMTLGWTLVWSTVPLKSFSKVISWCWLLRNIQQNHSSGSLAMASWQYCLTSLVLFISSLSQTLCFKIFIALLMIVFSLVVYL